MARQVIKYENTTVDSVRSASEIAELVQRYGGTRFEQSWDPETGQLHGIRFAIRHGDDDVPVRLGAQTDRIVEILGKRPKYRHNQQVARAQAVRIAWRQLKDFVEQALLAVETGLFPVASAFMAHVEVWDTEADETVTMAEYVARRASLRPGGDGVLLLTRGDDG